MRRSIGILLAAGTLCLAAGAGAERVESVFDGGDPFVLVEGDTVWIYPTGGKGLESWSSTDLVHWRNHGPLLRKSRSEENTSELQSLMRISYAVFCLKKKTKHNNPIYS